MSHWGQHIASWAVKNNKKPSIVEAILKRKGWDPDKYLSNMESDLNYYLDQWYELSIKKLPAPATARRRNPYRRNADDKLRRLERIASEQDTPESHNALFLERLRIGLLSSAQIELLLAIGFIPALEILDREPRDLQELLLTHRKIVVCRWAYEAAKMVFSVWEDFLNRLVEEEIFFDDYYAAKPAELMIKIEKWLIKQKGSERFSGDYWSMERVASRITQGVREKYQDYINPYGELAHPINRPREGARQALLSLGRVADTISCNWIGSAKSHCIELASDAHDTALYALLNMAYDPNDPEMEQRIRRQEIAWAMYHWMFS